MARANQNINSCTFSGNLTRDAEFAVSGRGVEYTRFSLAVSNRVYNPANDTVSTVPVFIDCIAFGREAVEMRGAKKGSKVTISTRLEQSVYLDKDTGKSRRGYSFRVISVERYDDGDVDDREWHNPKWI